MLNLKIFLRKINYSLVLIFLIPIILNIIWFKNDNIMGMAESGLPFYNFQIAFDANKSAWNYYALGFPSNIGVAAKPAYWFMAQLQNIGIPGFILQASFFWIILTFSGISIYFITKILFPGLGNRFLILAVLFYWFNPFSMVNVWNRFLNNFLVFYAFLPLVLLLFIKGIRSRKYIYAILIGLSSLIFSYALSSITFSLILWFVLSYTALFYLVLNKQGDKLFVVKFFAVLLFFWFLINFWWIGQVLSYLGEGSFTAVATTSFKTDSNYQTFYILSQRLGNLTDLLRLKHASFFADIEHINWVGIYQFPVLTFFEFLVVGIFLLPVVVRRRQPGVLFLGGLFLLSIFFTKGNSPPLGEIFDKVFRSLSFLQLFRNPLEKIGFIPPIAAAPLFCLGASLLIGKLRDKWRKIVYLVLLSWLLIIWGGPFWTGLVFTGAEVPINKVDVGYQVKVPEFYKDASNWLSSQGNNFRLVIFPIGGEGVTYTWHKGYSGVELSNQLLPVTSVSFNTNIPFYNEVSKNLERIFLTRENFLKIMDALNSKYVVIRSDIDWRIRGMRDPQVIQRRLEALEASGKFKQVKQFGDLQFWEHLDWTDRTIYPAEQLIKVRGTPAIEDLLNVEKKQDSVIYSSRNALGEDGLIGSEIIRPITKFGLGSKRLNTTINISDEFMFPSVRILPSNLLYPMILFKEKIGMILIRDQNTLLLKKLSLLGKRLNEAEIEAEKGQPQGTQKALSLYDGQLKEVLPNLSKVSQVGGDYFLLQEDVYKIFLKHFDKINRIKDSFPQEKKEEILSLKKMVEKNLADFGIIPYFGYLEAQNFPIKQRVVYQFVVEKDGNYEFLLDTKSWNKYFKVSLDEPLLFQVDNGIISREGMLDNNGFVSYGFFNFTAGKHEIAWNTPNEINLVNIPSELTLMIDHGVVEKSFPINNLDPYSEYVLNLNYLIKKGSGVEVIVEQNNDKLKKDKIEPRYGKFLGPDTYDFENRNFSAYFIPSTTADNAKLIFRVKPWNNCEEIYRTKREEKCLDENFRRPYDRITKVSLNNISLVKVSTEIPILRRNISESSDLVIPKIDFRKINAGEYKVKVEGAQGPFILVLSQLFDPAWKIYIDGKETGKEHFLANAYANGWIIEKSGSYELTVKFAPQDLLLKGEIISSLAFIVSLIIILWELRKNHYERN